MTSQFRNEAWLDLQEVHSSLNYLKEKLNKTGQKIDATSSSGPIQFSFPGLPVRSTGAYGTDGRAAGYSEVVAPLAGDKRHRGNLQNARPTELRSGEPSKRSGPCDGHRTFVEPVCINKEVLPWDAFPRHRRLSGRRDKVASSVFASGDDRAGFDAAGVGLRPSSDLIGYENGAPSGATDKLRRVIERQRRAAERRGLKRHQALPERDAAPRDPTHPRPQPYVPSTVPPPRPEHQEHVAVPLEIPENLKYVAVPRKIHHRTPTVVPDAAVDRVSRKKGVELGVEDDVSEHFLRSEVPGEDYVEDYLEFLRMRIEEKEKEATEKPPNTLADAPRIVDGEWPLEEARYEDQDANGNVEPVIWKRKVVSMPQPKEYRGFSLVGGSPKVNRKKQRAAVTKPSAPPVASSDPAVSAKSPTVAPQEEEHARPSKQTSCAMNTRVFSLHCHKCEACYTQKPKILSFWVVVFQLNHRNINRFHAFQLSWFNAQLNDSGVFSCDRLFCICAEAAERPSPAPKVRHYDAPAVRDFIARQRRSWQEEQRRAQQSTAQVVRAKEERLERLYALQRRTARVSAQRGRQRHREQQEEEAFVDQFVERLKSIPVRNGAASSPRHEMDNANVSSDADSSASNECFALLEKQPFCLDRVEHASGVSEKTTSPAGAGTPGGGGGATPAGNASSAVPGPPATKTVPPEPITTTVANQADESGKQSDESAFQYEPTEQVRNLGRLAASINNMIDGQMLRMGIPNFPLAPKFWIIWKSQGIIREIAKKFAKSGKITSASGTAVRNEARQSSISVAAPNNHAGKVTSTEETVRKFYRNTFFALWRQDSEKSEASKAPREVVATRDVSVYDKAVSAPSLDGTRLSTLDEEPSHHLMPDPNNIASAWRKKNVKAFLTSTQLGGESMLPSFSKTAGLPLSPLKALREAEPSQRMSEGTSGELRSSLLPDDSAPRSTSGKSHGSAGRRDEIHDAAGTRSPAKIGGTAVRSRESRASHVTSPPVGTESAEMSQRGTVVPSIPASRDVSQAFAREVPCRETGVLPLQRKVQFGGPGLARSSAALPPLKADGEVAVPAAGTSRRVNLDDDRAWILLEAQAKAALASAETARQLVQDHGPSMMERRSEDLARLLTAGTVAAASALAASLATRGFGSYVQPSLNAEEKRPATKEASSSASSTTAPGITDEGSFESDDDKTSTTRQTTTEESRSPPLTKDGAGGGGGVPEAIPAELDTSKDASKDGALSGSISEELGALGLSDSSMDKRREKPATPSKRRQPKNVVPLSADSSATEDSTGARMWSQSSAFDPLLLDRDLLSCSLTEVGREGEGEGRPLALLRLQERDVVERARAELAWLEVLKRWCREAGSEDRMPALRKKQRGILIRLHQKRAELKALQARYLAQPRSKASVDASSAPAHSVTEVPPDRLLPNTFGQFHPCVVSNTISDNANSFASSCQAAIKFLSPCVSLKVEMGIALSPSHLPSYIFHIRFLAFLCTELPEDSTHLKLNASKRLLEERQQELQSRRKKVQELLDWQKRLNAEEASVRALERRALARLRARAAKLPQGESWPSKGTPPSQHSMSTLETGVVLVGGYNTNLGSCAPIEFKLFASVILPIQSSREHAFSKLSSGDQPESSTIKSQVEPSGSSLEAEVQTETLTRRSSGSSGSHRSSPRGHEHPPPPPPRALAALLLKSPLVPRMRVPRDSGSGSEDSFNVSLSETASDQSDIEGRILALSEELKKRQLEAVQLRKEQRRRRTEFLREKEQSLKRHIEVYDTLIQQAKEELEKELDLVQQEKSVCVKPQIKKPRAAEQRKHRIPQLTPDGGGFDNCMQVPQARSSKAKAESPPEISLNGSSSKTVSEAGVPTEVPSTENVDATSSVQEPARDVTATVTEDSKAAVSEEISERVSEEASFGKGGESSRSRVADASVSSARVSSTKASSVKEPGISVRSEKPHEVSEEAISESAPSSLDKTEASSSHRTEPPLSAKDLNESSAEETLKSSLEAIEENSRSLTEQSPERFVEAALLHPVEGKTTPVGVNEAEAEEPSEGDFEAIESFAEYSEEVVRSAVVDGSDWRAAAVEDDADQDEKVERAVESIWCRLLDDTALAFREALLETRELRATEADEDHLDDASARFSGGTGTTESGGKVSHTELDETNESLASRGSGDGSDNSAASATEPARQGDQWDGSELDSIAKKMVSDAISSVLAVAREKGVLAAAAGDVTRVSDVSRKVSVILASIEEKRSNRELQRPQDLMVLSTDLDEDEVAWKDAPAVFLALDQEAEPQKSGKELCSRAVQAEDCFLSTTSEQDWFDDDFGLGSGDQVFAYQRCIPNKPPPPYSPPRGGLTCRMPQGPTWSVPQSEADVAAIVRKAAALVYEAAMRGDDVEALHCDPGVLEDVGQILGASSESSVEAESRLHYLEFLFDLTKELAQEIFCIGPPEVFPPWQRGVRLRRRRPLPASQEDFVAALEQRALSVRGLGPDRADAATNGWDASRDTNFVDALLHREVCQEEPEWVDYSREEVLVKDQVADAIFLLLVDDTVEELKRLWNQAR
ncbi:unnamed protein product [Ixodes hexagonus]